MNSRRGEKLLCENDRFMCVVFCSLVFDAPHICLSSVLYLVSTVPIFSQETERKHFFSPTMWIVIMFSQGLIWPRSAFFTVEEYSKEPKEFFFAQ
mmetsp:Transcript_9752/g.21727  ORF Transcript_9752/g.21727 Transcript_9752/m.21727 type:complete len:95 (-) Transcript_9752:2361-2645(-)